jgi:hypothetical protein
MTTELVIKIKLINKKKDHVYITLAHKISSGKYLLLFLMFPLLFQVVDCRLLNSGVFIVACAKGLGAWRISEHKTVNTSQKLMRGKMFN